MSSIIKVNTVQDADGNNIINELFYFTCMAIFGT